MPTKAPPPPARSQKPPSSPVGQKPSASVDPTLPFPRAQVAPEPATPVEPKPPAKIRIRTRYGYPIHIPHLQRLIRPEETVELDDHDWIRKQIGYGTFILLED